jgi:uncharacterized membrane protein
MPDDPEGYGPVIAGHYTSVVVVAGLALVSILLLFGRFVLAAVPLAGTVLALAFAGRIRRALASGPPDGATDHETARALDELRLLYADGEIGDEEYERRYDAIVEEGPEAAWGRTDDAEPWSDPPGIDDDP